MSDSQEPPQLDAAKLDRETDTGESADRETVGQPSSMNSSKSTDDGTPQKLGRFRVERVLGHGGMGDVYLAHDEQLHRPIALKMPRLEGKDPVKVRKRFLREARAAATVQHRNICPVYDIGEIEGRPYIAMAFIEGNPLTRYIHRNKGIPAKKAVNIVRKIGKAIREAHQAGIVHRDLKPSNIMIDREGEPVIMDFGLAGLTEENDSETRLTKDGAILGTPAYMPPEQVNGKLHEVGPRSDIYSLGIIFYELLAGKPPFVGTVVSILAQVVAVEPEPLRKVKRNIEPVIESLCMRMIAKSPDRRPESMREVVGVMTDYLRGTASANSSVDQMVLTPPPIEGAVGRSHSSRASRLEANSANGNSPSPDSENSTQFEHQPDFRPVDSWRERLVTRSSTLVEQLRANLTAERLTRIAIYGLPTLVVLGVIALMSMIIVQEIFLRGPDSRSSSEQGDGVLQPNDEGSLPFTSDDDPDTDAGSLAVPSTSADTSAEDEAVESNAEPDQESSGSTPPTVDPNGKDLNQDEADDALTIDDLPNDE